MNKLQSFIAKDESEIDQEKLAITLSQRDQIIKERGEAYFLGLVSQIKERIDRKTSEPNNEAPNT
jgi:hypothetical protein